MNSFPEYQLDIWLNTPVRYLEKTTACNLREAKNDRVWGKAANDYHSFLPYAKYGCEIRSLQPYSYPRDLQAAQLNQQANDAPEAFVKFKVVSSIVGKHCTELKASGQCARPKVVNLGCDMKLIKGYLDDSVDNMEYVGVDKLPRLKPDVSVDLTHPLSGERIKSLRPDVLLCLDILPELFHNTTQLRSTLARLASGSSHSSLIVFSIPQRITKQRTSDIVRSKNRPKEESLNTNQWVQLLGEYFEVEQIQGFGFLADGASTVNRDGIPENSSAQTSMFNRMKERLSQLKFFNKIDIQLTRTFGTWPIIRPLGSKLLLVASPK